MQAKHVPPLIDSKRQLMMLPFSLAVYCLFCHFHAPPTPDKQEKYFLFNLEGFNTFMFLLLHLCMVMAQSFPTMLTQAIEKVSTGLSPEDRYYSKLAYDSILDGNLLHLKRHPLLQLEQPYLQGYLGATVQPNFERFKKLQQYSNNFLLLAAVDQGYFEIVTFLIEEVKVDVNQATSGGETALHRACYRNRPQIARYLIEEAKANIEARLTSRDNRLILTPLFQACQKERLEAIEVLLEYGARIDFENFKKAGDTTNCEPQTRDYFSKLAPQIQDLFYRHHKLRSNRVFIKMHHYVKEKKAAEKNGAVFDGKKLWYSQKECEMIEAHYPEAFMGLNKNLKDDILKKYLA